jgi:lipoprotein-anchoring transpeptidase ErfK/SrfK
VQRIIGDGARLDRRAVLGGLGAGLVASLVAGCASTGPFGMGAEPGPRIPDYYRQIYGQTVDNGFVIPAVDLTQVPEQFWRTEVADPTGEVPGTIVVATGLRYLYLVREGGRAIRYGVGIGRDGFTWAGDGYVGRKAPWPTWTPPRQMLARQPETRQWAAGMPGGLDNPLGARGLYIFSQGRDTIYRIHGTPESWSIGQAVSSGCVRLINQDVIDLYARVPRGSRIVVRA